MNRISLTAALAAAFLLSACSDDDLGGRGNVVPMTPGTEIVFGAALSDDARTRTVYGEQDGNVFPVYWSHPDDEKGEDGIGTGHYDEIYIYSPESTDCLHARYSVRPPEPKYKGEATVPVVKLVDKGIVTGNSGEKQTFYGFYPYDAILGTLPTAGSTQDYVYANMPVSQEVWVSAADKSGNTYAAKHDMKLAFMRSSHVDYVLNANEPVKLQFDPWSTVLDITVPGPSGGGEKCTVTKVIVKSRQSLDNHLSMDAPDIAGSFKCYLTKETTGDNGDYVSFEKVTDNLADEPDNIVNIDIYDEAKNVGAKDNPDAEKTPGFELSNGEFLNLKAFLVPTNKVIALDVEVYSSAGENDNRVWVKTIDCSGDNGLVPGQIHQVRLPAITLPGVQDYSSWMTDLPDDIPVTNISLPGSYDAFSYLSSSSNVNTQLQLEDITAQFEAGIRAFSVHVQVNQYIPDPYITYLTANGKGALVSSSNTSLTLGSILHTLHQEMQARGNKEFCVVTVVPNAAAQNGGNFGNIIRDYANYMQREDMLPPTNLKDFTLGSLRGRILLHTNLDGDPTTAAPATIKNAMTYGYPNATGYQTVYSPLSSVQRVIGAKLSTHQVHSWDTQEIIENDFKKYINYNPAMTLSYGPWWWTTTLYTNNKPDGVNSVDVPLLLSYSTTTNLYNASLTPVTYARIGDVTYEFKYTTDAQYKAAVAENSAVGVDDEWFYNLWKDETTSTKMAPGFTQPGLRYLHAYMLWKNIKKVTNSDGKVIIYSTPDFLDDVEAAGQYPTLHAMSPYMLLHGEPRWDVPDAEAQKGINAQMWGTSSKVKQYRQKFGDHLFVTTILGVSVLKTNTTDNVRSKCRFLIESFLNNICASGNDENESNPLVLKDEWQNIPLGVVYMPYVPYRGTDFQSVADADEAYIGVRVRKLVELMKQHSLKCVNADK